MKNNQKGFSAVEILLIVVIVGLVGFVGWWVWHNRASNTTSTPAATTTTQSATPSTSTPAITDPYEGWKTYTGFGIIVKYPQDWKFDERFKEGHSVDLRSPGFVFAETEDEQKGQNITIIDGSYPQQNMTADNFEAMQLKPNPNSYSEFKKIEVNGRIAVQYYRGDSRTTVFFVGDKYVDIILDNFPNRADKSETYDLLVKSVKY